MQLQPVLPGISPAAAEVRQVLRDPVQRLPQREALRRPRRLLHGPRPLRRRPQQYTLPLPPPPLQLSTSLIDTHLALGLDHARCLRADAPPNTIRSDSR